MPQPTKSEIKSRYDDCCPHCGEAIDWNTLAEKFNSQVGLLTADKAVRGMDCPHCDELLLIKPIVYFQLEWKN